MCDIMFHIGLNRLRISSTLKLLCLLTVIVSTIIILFHQSHHQALSRQDQVSQSRGRISSSSSAWARENRDPSILSRKVKNHQESIPGSSSAGAGSDSRGGGRGGQAAEEEDGDLASAAAASLHNALSQGRIKGPQELFSVNHGIQVESFLDDCGLNHDCPNDHFSIHLFTGFEDKIYPRLCVDGKYILDKGVNGCGRGINVAVIDSLSKSITSVSNYDTYDQDSTSLETLLLKIREGDIVILLTFDEPSSKLSQVARLLLHELGSGKAQNLNYRTSWYLITQKGITGYSPYEEIHLPSYNASQPARSVWGSSHDVSMCLPLRFEGVPVQAEETIRKNPDRHIFCLKFANIWPYFCESHVVNEPLIPSTVSRIPVSNDLFKTPVLLLTQGSHIDEFSDLSLTLETLLRQPGIEPKNVIVFYNITCCPSIRHLVNLFGFMSIAYPEQPPGDEEQIDLLKDSLQTAQLLFPEANQLILMESHLILSPDFLPFFGQMIPILSNRESGIQAVSAWNENGLVKTSSDARIVFRADARLHGARLAVMIRRIPSFDDWNERSSKRPSWSFDPVPSLPFQKIASAHGAEPGGYVLFPDVSRVSIIVASLQMDQQENTYHDAFIQEYLSKARTLNTDEDARILNLDLAYNASSYESSIRKRISSQQKYSLDQAAILASGDPVGAADHSNQDNGVTSKKSKIMIVDAGNENGWERGCQYFQLVNCNPHLQIKGIGHVICFTIADRVQVFLLLKLADQETTPEE